MKILHLATTDQGGAGIASKNLNDLLNNLGHKSKLIVKYSKEKSDNVISFSYSSSSGFFLSMVKIKNRAIKLLEVNSKTNKKYAFYNANERKQYFNTKKILNALPFKPDAIFIHWTSGFINSKTVYELAQKTKARMFLLTPDMSPMTGGCHYAWDCNGYKNECGCCPAIYSNNENDKSRLNWLFKKHYIDKTDLIIIYGNDYIYNQLKQSSLFKNKQKVKIPRAIDENVFAPGDKDQARKDLKIPLERKVILFGASNISNPRKGLKEFFEVLDVLRAKYNANDLYISIIGKNEINLIDNIAFDCSCLGHLNLQELVKAYQAADLFISSSVQDSGPLTVNQAMMCGTPVVSFNIGAAVDLVNNQTTGYKANCYDTHEMADGVLKILKKSNKEYEKMSYACRKLALNTNSVKVVSIHYQKLLSGLQ